MTAEPSQPADDTSDHRQTCDHFRAAYNTLHDLAAAYLHRERADHTLQPTALLHEAYLKLQRLGGANWQSETHFQAVAANAMRQVLVDHARAKATKKRGGEWHRVSMAPDTLGYQQPVDLIALDDAMQKLHAFDQRKCQVVELRFFGGLTNSEAAEHLGVSPKTTEADWYFARAWLRDQLSESTA